MLRRLVIVAVLFWAMAQTALLREQGVEYEPQILVVTRLIPEAGQTTCNQRLEAILNSAIDGIVTIDENGIIMDANPSACRLFDFPPEALLGWEVGDWHVSHDKLVAYMQALAAASPRVSIKVIGHTHEQRPLLQLTITSAPNQDLEGNPRPVDNGFDIGAYEFLP